MQYGHAMMQYLPTGGFEWVHLDTTSPEYWTQFINKQKDEQEKGYFVQVDLHYPKELHDKHDKRRNAIRPPEEISQRS